jgi:hypothetical protein
MKLEARLQAAPKRKPASKRKRKVKVAGKHQL